MSSLRKPFFVLLCSLACETLREMGSITTTINTGSSIYSTVFSKRVLPDLVQGSYGTYIFPRPHTNSGYYHNKASCLSRKGTSLILTEKAHTLTHAHPTNKIPCEILLRKTRCLRNASRPDGSVRMSACCEDVHPGDFKPTPLPPRYPTTTY